LVDVDDDILLIGLIFLSIFLFETLSLSLSHSLWKVMKISEVVIQEFIVKMTNFWFTKVPFWW
jgi:hypothetical protein